MGGFDTVAALGAKRLRIANVCIVEEGMLAALAASLAFSSDAIARGGFGGGGGFHGGGGFGGFHGGYGGSGNLSGRDNRAQPPSVKRSPQVECPVGDS
jgi:hypothetical protein